MGDQAAMRQTIRQRLFELLERGRRRDTAARLWAGLLVVLIIANVTAIVAGTVPAVAERYGRALTLFDRVCVAIFVIEYILRLWTAPEHPMLRDGTPWAARLSFAATPLMIVDLLALLPLPIELAFPSHAAELKLLALVRFLKLARHSPALATIGRVVAAERRALAACIIIFVGILLAGAAIMHVVEGKLQPHLLGDMPNAIWWATVVLTKLGHSEVVPQTLLGRLVAAMAMIVGIGFFALPVAIIGRGFYDEIRRRDFVVTFGMVARVPVLADLDAATIAELVSRLQARKVSARTVIIRKGDPADALYLIASGQVQVQLDAGPVTLSDGDFFGEMALLSHGRRMATVTAKRTTELLVLDASDFDRLIEGNPRLAETVKRTAKARLAGGGQSAAA